jgi:hypothetical protein
MFSVLCAFFCTFLERKVPKELSSGKVLFRKATGLVYAV